MRYLYLLLLFPIITSCVGSKIFPSSSGVRPNWVHGMQKGYLIVHAEGSTHEEAKSEAMLLVKDHIIASISSFVTSNAQYATSESSQNEVERFIDNYEQVVDIHSEHFESLKGISPAKASGYYWERQKLRTGDRIHYHILYPFSVEELNALVNDYNRINQALDTKLSTLAFRNMEYDSVETILSDIRQLEFMHPILPKHKKPMAQKRIAQLHKLIRDIQIYRLTDEPDRLIYRLQLYGEPLYTHQNPEIFASCDLNVEKVQATPGGIVMKYKGSSCSHSKDPYFTIQYIFGSTRVTRDINIHPTGS